MKWQLLAPWWLIVPYALAALGAAGWQLYRVRHEGRGSVVRWCRRALLPLLVVLMLLGPSVPGGSSAPGIENLDVLFAVDTTASMGSQDYAGTQLRLDGVKKDLLALGGKLQGAHLSLLTFDSTANIVLPFTTDASAFATAVQTLNRENSDYSKGSAIDKPISLITQTLKDSRTAHPERSRLLFYLGDGEQTADAPVQSFAPIASYISGGAVLGYGTTKGAQMLKAGPGDTNGTPSYVKTLDTATGTFVPAVSKMDPAALQKIAGQLGVAYQDRDQATPIATAFTASKLPLLIDESQHITRYLNLYWLAAIPFAALIFWEWQALLLEYLSLRRSKAGGEHA